jgi:hypothetical protein
MLARTPSARPRPLAARRAARAARVRVAARAGGRAVVLGTGIGAPRPPPAAPQTHRGHTAVPRCAAPGRAPPRPRRRALAAFKTPPRARATGARARLRPHPNPHPATPTIPCRPTGGLVAAQRLTKHFDEVVAIERDADPAAASAAKPADPAGSGGGGGSAPRARPGVPQFNHVRGPRGLGTSGPRRRPRPLPCACTAPGPDMHPLPPSHAAVPRCTPSWAAARRCWTTPSAPHTARPSPPRAGCTSTGARALGSAPGRRLSAAVPEPHPTPLTHTTPQRAAPLAPTPAPLPCAPPPRYTEAGVVVPPGVPFLASNPAAAAARPIGFYSSSRALLEGTARGLLAANPKVTLRYGEAAQGLVFGSAGVGGAPGAVRGVKLAGGEVVEADLVVDASGRASRAGEWLAAGGWAAPAARVVDADCGYVSRRAEGRQWGGQAAGRAGARRGCRGARRVAGQRPRPAPHPSLDPSVPPHPNPLPLGCTVSPPRPRPRWRAATCWSCCPSTPATSSQCCSASRAARGSSRSRARRGMRWAHRRATTTTSWTGCRCVWGGAGGRALGGGEEVARGPACLAFLLITSRPLPLPRAGHVVARRAGAAARRGAAGAGLQVLWHQEHPALVRLGLPRGGRVSVGGICGRDRGRASLPWQQQRRQCRHCCPWHHTVPPQLRDRAAARGPRVCGRQRDRLQPRCARTPAARLHSVRATRLRSRIVALLLTPSPALLPRTGAACPPARTTVYGQVGLGEG